MLERYRSSKPEFGAPKRDQVKITLMNPGEWRESAISIRISLRLENFADLDLSLHLVCI